MTKPLSGIEWAEPPTPRPTYPWLQIAADLMLNPMRWAKVFDDGKVSVVNAVRQGSVRVLAPDLGFEVRTTNNATTEEGKKCSLYMRWNPEKDRRVTSVTSDPT